MTKATDNRDELLFNAARAHGKMVRENIRRMAAKTYREQMRFGFILAALAICTAIALAIVVNFITVPGNILFVALGGALLFFAFTAAAILVFTFARQQKKFM